VTDNRLPTTPPIPTAETEEFWAATAKGTLLLARCDACENVIWYPKGFCSACSSFAISWFPASGRGTVYSFTIVRRGLGAWQAVAPYVIAYVELEEGPRVMTNIVGCDQASVRVAMPVEIVFDDTGEGNALYRFRPSP
jgi:uncharacterized OB-fold protein